MNHRTTTRDCRRQAGVGMVELVVATAIVVVVAAIAVPSFLQGYQNYKLNQATATLSGVLKSVRFQSIRQNQQISFRTLNGATGTQLWGDTDNNGAMSAGETGTVLAGSVNLIAAGSVPNTAGLATAVNTLALTAIPTSSGTLTFDVRGAPTPAAVDVLYLNNVAAPRAGYRAVVVMPSGAMQTWTADPAGNWSQVN